MHYSIKTFDWSHLDQLDQRDEQKDEIAYIHYHIVALIVTVKLEDFPFYSSIINVIDRFKIH